MRGVGLLGLLGVGLLSCSATTGPNTSEVRGWRYAGLQSPDPRGEGQFTGIIAVGEKLFVRTGNGQLWCSHHYSIGWDTVPLPKGAGVLRSLATDGQNLFLGTKRPGKVWKYEPSSGQFADLLFPLMDTSNVYTLAMYRGDLVASASNGTESRFMYLSKGIWQDWSEGYKGGTTYRMQSVGDTLWVATYDQNPWYRVWGEPSWKRLPAMKQTWGEGILDTSWHPRGLAWHRGDMWIGWYSSEVTQLKSGALPYSSHRNCEDRKPDACKDIPLHIFTLMEYRDRLFLTGYWPASGFVLDDASGKFMPMEDGWCWDNGTRCGGTTTWSLAGLGDTIYAAANANIMKFPLSDLPQPTAENKALWKWPADSVKTVP